MPPREPDDRARDPRARREPHAAQDPHGSGAPRGPQDARSPAPPGGAVEPAGIVRRGIAFTLDLALAALVGWGARRLAPDGPDAPAWMREHAVLAFGLTCALPAWLALALCESLPGRASPGKRVLGLALALPRGGAPSLARVAARTAIKLFPWLVAALALLFPEPWNGRDPLERWRLVLLLGSNLWIGIFLAAAAMTRRRQSLHDLATGTVVRAAPR